MILTKYPSGWRYAIITEKDELLGGSNSLLEAMKIYRRHKAKRKDKKKDIGIVVSYSVLIPPALAKELRDKEQRRKK